MKSICAILFLLLTVEIGFSQDQNSSTQNNNEGKLYFYWGWNRGVFTNSDINFKGADYDFTLKNVVGRDRQSKFGIDPYFSPSKVTIPQYNFRIGYFIKRNFNISFGIDHMKYVIIADQVVKISGTIGNSGTEYDGTYQDEDISLSNDFLQLEHTDGLNYPHIGLRYFHNLFDFAKIKISDIEGISAGILLPRTNTSLLNNERYDEFHLSGYGMSVMVGINVALYKHYFIQTEFKGGFMNLPDIRTTPSKLDKASQKFFFSQINIVFGVILNLKKTESK